MEISKRDVVASLSGVLFCIAWGLFADSYVYVTTPGNPGEVPKFECWLPGIGSTLAFLMINILPKEELGADKFTYSGDNVATKAKVFMTFAVLLQLGSLAGAASVLALVYGDSDSDGMYPGLAILFQSLLITFSCWMLRLVDWKDDEDF